MKSEAAEYKEYLETSISNTNIRLDVLRDKLEQVVKEYNQKKTVYGRELQELEERIEDLEKEILTGEVSNRKHYEQLILSFDIKN